MNGWTYSVACTFLPLHYALAGNWISYGFGFITGRYAGKEGRGRSRNRKGRDAWSEQAFNCKWGITPFYLILTMTVSHWPLLWQWQFFTNFPSSLSWKWQFITHLKFMLWLETLRKTKTKYFIINNQTKRNISEKPRLKVLKEMSTKD